MLRRTVICLSLAAYCAGGASELLGQRSSSGAAHGASLDSSMGGSEDGVSQGRRDGRQKKLQTQHEIAQRPTQGSAHADDDDLKIIDEDERKTDNQKCSAGDEKCRKWTDRRNRRETGIGSDQHSETSLEIRETTEIEIDPETESSQDSDDSGTSESEDVIVVVAVDGSIAGLSKLTGELLWKHAGAPSPELKKSKMNNNFKQNQKLNPEQRKENESGSNSNDTGKQMLNPLVSTSTTTKTASDDWKTTAVPSVDGKVYLTASDVTVVASVRDLVERSPFVDSRGMVYVGRQSSSAMAIDRDSGEILLVVSNRDPLPVNDKSLDDRNVVWIGKVEHSISVHDARSGAADVQFSVAEVMSVADMVGENNLEPWDSRVSSDDRKKFQHEKPTLTLPNRHSRGNPFFRSSEAQFSALVATPSGHVAYRNQDRRVVEWVAKDTFHTPIVFAIESSSGKSINVDIIQDAPIPDSSIEYMSREMEKQLELLGSTENDGDQTIVRALANGQLFAMPLGKSISASPLSPLDISHQHTIASASSVSSSNGHASKIHSGATRPNLSLNKDGKTMQTYHDLKLSAIKRPCHPNMPSFPGCLAVNAAKFSTNEEGHFLSESYPQHGEIMLNNGIAVVGDRHGNTFYQYHPDLHLSLIGKIPSSRRNKYYTAMKIMGSWLPPLVTLLFVMSFELGRRKRQRDLLDKVNDVESNVLQVSEDVLGYGGQGTVVYKGMLDGRSVAVKRMLMAYHASAEREISLLIESDGHPNVVRYFLKEIRGDFVYLALELCDLSLHDLITTIRSHEDRSINGGDVTRIQTTVPRPTKLILQQIACGVKHIHSLRIVHRDLKPANILLAVSGRQKGQSANKSDSDQIVSLFLSGAYIAKISDMGLGKQLAGQSSLGFNNTLTGSSLRGQSKNGEASLVGVGPGSVGWQAPEVMAARWPSDSSNPSEDAYLRQVSGSNDASPADGGSNGYTSRSSDIFSLGCIFFSALLPGRHPFGEWFEREANIVHYRPNIDALLEISPDAYDLIRSMIDRNPRSRPTATQICNHPFFWTAEMRLAFLCDLSDRLESNATPNPNSLSSGMDTEAMEQMLVFERNAGDVVGTAWDKCLDVALVSNVQRFRSYDPSSVRDLLRLIRNKRHHFDELPIEFRSRIGSTQIGLLDYFEERFPNLLMHAFHCCKEVFPINDPLASKYSIPIPKSIRSQKFIDTGARNIPTLQEESAPTTVEVLVSSDENLNDDDDDDIAQDAVPNTPTFQPIREEEEISGCESTLPTFDEKSGDELILDEENANVNGSETTNGISTPELEEEKSPLLSTEPITPAFTGNVADIVIWEGSAAAKAFNCRGWIRSDSEWTQRADSSLRKSREITNLMRCTDDPKFRTRLCNHWDESLGTFCPMRRKGKCVFAHGPAELRVKEAKRGRWGKLVDKNGNNSNTRHSGGEDTYGAAKSIESVRKVEGKWNTNKKSMQQPKKQSSSSSSSSVKNKKVMQT